MLRAVRLGTTTEGTGWEVVVDGSLRSRLMARYTKTAPVLGLSIESRVEVAELDNAFSRVDHVAHVVVGRQLPEHDGTRSRSGRINRILARRLHSCKR